MSSKSSYPYQLPSVDDLSTTKYTNPDSSSNDRIGQIGRASIGSVNSENSAKSTASRTSISDPLITSSEHNTSSSSTNTVSLDGDFVKLARRRANRQTKEKSSHKRVPNLSRPQGRPLSKETRVRLTLVPTLGILYSILVSDNMRKSLRVVKYADTEKDSMVKTNEEMSTRNIISGFSSLLNVQTVRFIDDPSISPNKQSTIPEFTTIDEAVYNLFGITEYSLIRVTRAAATEVGGSVLLKIETAMPGHLYLNDDEDEDFQTVELNKDYYQESIGSIGDRPSTTFLKKRVARPRYKSDMRIYLIPKSVSCAIYCELRMFKRDLMRGFLSMENLDRSVVVAFDYENALKELEEQGHGDLINDNFLPNARQVKELDESAQLAFNQSQTINHNDGYLRQAQLQAQYAPSTIYQVPPPSTVSYPTFPQYQPNLQYSQGQPIPAQQPQAVGFQNFNPYASNFQQQQQPQQQPPQQQQPQQQSPLPTNQSTPNQSALGYPSSNNTAQGNSQINGLYTGIEPQYLAQTGFLPPQMSGAPPNVSYVSGSVFADGTKRYIDPYNNNPIYYQPQPQQQQQPQHTPSSSISAQGGLYQTAGPQQYASNYAVNRPDESQAYPSFQ